MGMKAKSYINLFIQMLILLNGILMIFGINPIPFDEDELYQALSALAMILDGVWVWWKNMPTTKAGIHAQEFLNLHRDDSEEKEEFFEEDEE